MLIEDKIEATVDQGEHVDIQFNQFSSAQRYMGLSLAIRLLQLLPIYLTKFLSSQIESFTVLNALKTTRTASKTVTYQHKLSMLSMAFMHLTHS